MAKFVVKRVLMVAFHYPPVKGSSGVHRTLKFSQYLPEFGWEPIVLTVHPRAYEATSPEQLADIPARLKIHRAFALDARKHLGRGGVYPKWLARPDRWVSWWLAAVPAGMRLIRQYQPQVIWSTYPIATALLIGLSLQRRSRLPWVADFRDTMVDETYPPPGVIRQAYQRLEERTVRRCTKAVFTSPSAITYTKEKYPGLADGKWALIANGYDEENFSALTPLTPPHKAEQLVLVHSGTLYPSERDPRAFFAALRALRQQQTLSEQNLKIILRATGHDAYLAKLIREYEIDSMVFLSPPIPYQQALSEMMNADGLILMQAANCNRQVPAKLYEYLRARRPIFALTDPAGDTAKELIAAGINNIARIDDEADIVQKFSGFCINIRAGTLPVPSDNVIEQHSRYARTEQLAKLLDSIIASYSNSH